MDLKSGTLLVPPAVKNSSCTHPRYSSYNFIIHIGIVETIEGLLILILTLGVIGANVLVICVINNRRYAAFIHQQPRYLLTSLALNDLTIGLLITPFGLLPALFHCWPYGEIFCQIQALLRGALSQQSAVILVCMAVDRYMCALHPRRYYQHSSKKGCVAILSVTWITSLTVFGFLVLPKGYYFNHTGLMACEPFYSKPSYRILATCALYFPTTMVLMYCYGSSFHMSRFRLNDPTMPLTGALHHTMPSVAHAALAAHHHRQQLQQQQYMHQLQYNQQHQQNLQQQLFQQQHLQQQQLHQHHQQQLQHQQLQLQQQHMHHHGHHSHQHHHHQQNVNAASTPTTTTPTPPPAMVGGGVQNSYPTTIPSLSMAMNMGFNMHGLCGPKNTITKKIVPIQEKHSNGSTSRSMAAISLGFIVMVTPWTIQEIVTACTGSKLPPFLDFLVTWTALSNSLWNPFMYWLLNSDFRRLSRQLMPNICFPNEDTPEHKSSCCHINSDFEITTLPMPPEPPTSARNNADGGGGGGSVLGICTRAQRSNSLNRSASQHMQRGATASNVQKHGHTHGGYTTNLRPDIEGLSEKYWGEILERTVSSGSLHAMQKSFPHHTVHHGHHMNASAVGNTPATMTTSFSKNSDLDLTIMEHRHGEDDNGDNGVNCYPDGMVGNLNKFSTSEPKLCEHFQYQHDMNCAKNNAGPLGSEQQGNNSCDGRSIPDI